MKWWVILILGAVNLVYVVVGGLIFMVLERSREEETITATGSYRDTFLTDNTCVTTTEFNQLIQTVVQAYDQGVLASNDTDQSATWTAHTSIYFAVTVVTTIGYGNISPVTPGGRVFCIFFALFGIPLMLVLLGQLGVKINNQIARFDKWLVKKMTCGCVERHPKVSKIIRYIIIHMCGVVLFILIPAVIFMALENGWSYGDALYYSVITLTTVGFGDYVAGVDTVFRHPLYRLMIACWIVIGLSWMAALISSTQSVYDSTVEKAEKFKVNPKDKEKTDLSGLKGTQTPAEHGDSKKEILQ